MPRSWKLATAFGIGIFVNPTCLLLAAVVLLQAPVAGWLKFAVYEFMLLGAVLACIVFHELGHALMARLYGIGTREITLYPFGGVARLERMSERPVEEFWIAVAGPAVNVVIAGFLLSLLTAFAGLNDPEEVAPGGAGSFVFRLALINLGLVVFNLLPAFPMDGGRVLRALLTPLLGRLRATEVAAGLGRALAILFVLAGIFSGHLLLSVVGAFVYLVGQGELATVRSPFPE